MLPLHRTQTGVFNYEEIPAGYYYEVMRSGHPIQRFWHQKKFLDVARDLPQAGRILDLGCSAGSFLDMMAESRPDLTGVGVDIASRQIDYARLNVEPKHGGRVKFVQVDERAPHLPFEDYSFDAVTCVEVIEHIHPYLALKMLADARRILKPGGRLIVTTPNYRSAWPLIEWMLEKASPVKYHDQHINKYTPNSLIKFLECGGYKIGRVRTIFMAAPFMAGLSWQLAERIHQTEMSSGLRLGSLLVVDAQPDLSM